MVVFEVYNKYERFTEIVLNGSNFHLKLQEVLLGKGRFNNYYITSNRDIDDWDARVIDIDIEKEDINSYLFSARVREGMPHMHTNIRQKTLDEHYQKLSIGQNFDFYQNLRDYYGASKIKKIIHLYTKRNVSPQWLSTYFNIDIEEIYFLLKYLPCYYNYLKGD